MSTSEVTKILTSRRVGMIRHLSATTLSNAMASRLFDREKSCQLDIESRVHVYLLDENVLIGQEKARLKCEGLSICYLKKRTDSTTDVPTGEPTIRNVVSLRTLVMVKRAHQVHNKIDRSIPHIVRIQNPKEQANSQTCEIAVRGTEIKYRT